MSHKEQEGWKISASNEPDTSRVWWLQLAAVERVCVYEIFYGCGTSYLFNAIHIIDIMWYFPQFQYSFFYSKMESHQQTVILVSTFIFSSANNNISSFVS